ncbi:MAG: hypothetical protein IKM62_03025 [Kiritimatiellae bacterium]|nr:hypothetical protein [Kiritimatiellia bacterium]
MVRILVQHRRNAAALSPMLRLNVGDFHRERRPCSKRASPPWKIGGFAS